MLVIGAGGGCLFPLFSEWLFGRFGAQICSPPANAGNGPTPVALFIATFIVFWTVKRRGKNVEISFSDFFLSKAAMRGREAFALVAQSGSEGDGRMSSERIEDEHSTKWSREVVPVRGRKLMQLSQARSAARVAQASAAATLLYAKEGHLFSAVVVDVFISQVQQKGALFFRFDEKICSQMSPRDASGCRSCHGSVSRCKGFPDSYKIVCVFVETHCFQSPSECSTRSKGGCPSSLERRRFEIEILHS